MTPPRAAPAIASLLACAAAGCVAASQEDGGDGRRPPRGAEGEGEPVEGESEREPGEGEPVEGEGEEGEGEGEEGEGEPVEGESEAESEPPPACRERGEGAWSLVRRKDGPSDRHLHGAVWTGSEMIVWGGGPAESCGLDCGPRADGFRYSPEEDRWTPIAVEGAPTRRFDHSAVWTGSELIVWGGEGPDDTYQGGVYDPAADTWRPTTDWAAPEPRRRHSAVWAGSEMIVWGGSDADPPEPLGNGWRYHPAEDVWAPTATDGAPEPAFDHAAVWTGSEMIVWSGSGRFIQFEGWRHPIGGRYDPDRDAWTETATAGAPQGRAAASAAWSGSELIVWGGQGNDGQLADGGRYDPEADAWRAIAGEGAPAARARAPAIWTGCEMVLWGGQSGDFGIPRHDTGGRYDPARDRWTALPEEGAPSARVGHTVVWTGSALVIWGGDTRGAPNRGEIWTPGP